MTTTRQLTVVLAVTLLIAGCGDDNQKAAPKATPPEPAQLTITASDKKLATSVDSLPAEQVVRVDYKVSYDKKTPVQLANNGRVVNEVQIDRNDRIHVLLQPLTGGELTVKAGKRTATVEVTAK